METALLFLLVVVAVMLIHIHEDVQSIQKRLDILDRTTEKVKPEYR